MDDDDLRDDILQLEARIEELAGTIESCRKIILISRAAIAAGGLLLLAMAFGTIRLDALPLMAAITAVIGGIVLLGSNRRTADEVTAEMRAADARRAVLIEQMDLRIVDAGRT